jgi:hypothetical protein
MDSLRRFFPELSDEEVTQLVEVEVSLPHGRTASLAELLAGWAAHVDRLDADAQRDVERVDSWTEHDYVAALHIRDQVEQALGVAAAPTQRLAVEHLARADARFEGMTSPDVEHLLDSVIDRSEAGSGWWWARVPSQGPVRDGLLRLAGRRD